MPRQASNTGRFHMRLTPREMERLEALAERWGMSSKSAVVRRLINEAFAGKAGAGSAGPERGPGGPAWAGNVDELKRLMEGRNNEERK